MDKLFAEIQPTEDGSTYPLIRNWKGIAECGEPIECHISMNLIKRWFSFHDVHPATHYSYDSVIYARFSTTKYGGLKPGVAYCARGKTYVMYVQGWDQQLEVVLADRSNGRVNERVMMISLLDKNKELANDNSALRAEVARLQQTA